MILRKRVIGIIAGLLVMTMGFAEVPKNGNIMDINDDIAKGIELHNLARKEGMNAAEKASELLKPYVKENAVACAYYGSVQTVIAGIISEKNPIKALEYLQVGGEYLDNAVEMVPDEAVIHLIRLENGIEVSKTSPLKRYSVIKNDVKWFLDSDNISAADKEIKTEAYLYCGFYMIEAGDLDYALELFEESIAADPKSDSAKQAKKMLDKYTE